MEMRVGIIGFGFMGHWHADHMDKIHGISVRAISDINEEKLIEADARGLKVFSDYQDLLKDSEINTVLIATPNHLHKEMAIAAAKAKKNIICEKPAALGVEDFDEMIMAAEENKVLFSVHQNRRWDADFLTVKKILGEKQLGKVFAIESRLFGANGFVHDWHRYKKYGGGMIYDWGVHLLDQMLFLIPGKIKTVFADVRNVINSEVDDYFKAIFIYEEGFSYTVELGTYLLLPLPRWYVAGDQGTLVIKSFFDDAEIIRSGELLEKLPSSVEETKAGPTRAMAKRADEALVKETVSTGEPQWSKYYENYLAVMNGNGALAVKNSEVRRVLDLMEAVRLSAKLKQSINLE
jgi:scyllo-inositol 2-dehydrogenase (NADP+)